MTNEERKALVERLRSAADRKGKPSGVHMIDGQRAIAKVMLSKLDDEDAQAIGQVADCMALCIENEAMLFECLVSEVLPATNQIEADEKRIAELEAMILKIGENTADTVKGHMARVAELEAALREVFEMWAGSEGFIPETAAEGYLLELVKKMALIASAALGDKHD